MADDTSGSAGNDLTPAQQALLATWEAHLKHEFETQNTEATLETMVDEPWVNHVPVMTGGFGRQEVGEFYSTRFISRMPADTGMTLVSRTIGADRIVDEMVFRFTHSIEMDWMLPGIPPTGRAVQIPLVAVVHFVDNRVQSEHIYWDQASVLVQIGLLDATTLPVAGVETAYKVLDPRLPSNTLIETAEPRRETWSGIGIHSSTGYKDEV